MISFRSRDDILASVLTIVSILVLLGCLLVKLFVSPPTVEGMVKKRERTERTIEKEIAAHRAAAAAAAPVVAPRLWKGDSETITASVLAQLTHEANARQLKLGAFRPQRAVALEAVAEVPFSVQVSGPYPAVLAFASTLDAANSRLVLRSLQVASSDPASDAVTATLGVSAYGAVTLAPAPTGKEKSRG